MGRTAERISRCSNGSVFVRCGCRDESGRQWGKNCPQRGVSGHGSWSFEVRVGLAGSRRRVRRGGYDSAGLARRELAAYRRRNTQGCVAGSWTTGAWLNEWLAGHRAVRDSTLRSYASHLRLYLLPALGRIPLDELGIHDVQAMVEQIISDHFRAGRPIAAGTLVRIRATLLAGLKAAMRRGLIITNPAAMVELPAHPRCYPLIWTPERVALWKATGKRPAVGVWTAAHLHQFLEYTSQDAELGLLWRVVGLRGLRRGEACGLRWVDVDLDAGEFSVRQQLIEHGGSLHASEPKSAASRRTIALDADTVRLLRAHRAAQQARFGTCEYVFTDPHGAPVKPTHVTHRFTAAVRASGLPPVRLHDLRHGAATLALAAVDLKTVQAMLGHSTIVTTADIYTSVLPELQRDAAAAIAALVLAAGRNTQPTSDV
jgi:integrase